MIEGRDSLTRVTLVRELAIVISVPFLRLASLTPKLEKYLDPQ
jgi:hypothetical protein